MAVLKPSLKPSLGRYFVKWLDARYFKSVMALQCYSTHCFLSEERFLDLMISEPRSVGYVATTVKGAVGYLLYRLHPDENMVHFMDLVVHPDHRRKGIGRLLINRMKAATKRSTCILAKTSEHNTSSHVFLRANDFVAYHVWRDGTIHWSDAERDDAYCFIYSEDKEVVKEASEK